MLRMMMFMVGKKEQEIIGEGQKWWRPIICPQVEFNGKVFFSKKKKCEKQGKKQQPKSNWNLHETQK